MLSAQVHAHQAKSGPEKRGLLSPSKPHNALSLTNPKAANFSGSLGAKNNND
jgi:hypothetical protein